MSTLTAVVLVCLSNVSPNWCDETNTEEVRLTRVANELGCVTGWQEIMARADAAGETGRTTYPKTLHRRSPVTRRDCPQPESADATLRTRLGFRERQASRRPSLRPVRVPMHAGITKGERA